MQEWQRDMVNANIGDVRQDLWRSNPVTSGPQSVFVTPGNETVSLAGVAEAVIAGSAPSARRPSGDDRPSSPPLGPPGIAIIDAMMDADDAKWRAERFADALKTSAAHRKAAQFHEMIEAEREAERAEKARLIAAQAAADRALFEGRKPATPAQLAEGIAPESPESLKDAFMRQARALDAKEASPAEPIEEEEEADALDAEADAALPQALPHDIA
jgi:hypothetical protein